MRRLFMAIMLLVAGLPALAQKPAVAMLDLGGAGDASDADVVAVTDSLAMALDRAGAFDVIAPEHRDQLLMRRGFWIEGFKSLPERLTVAGRCLDADRMIGGQLEHGGAGFNLSLQLVDVASGAVSAQFKQERLAARGAVINALPDAVRQFLGAAQPGDTLKNKAPRGSYKIDSRPSGARIYIEGLARGVTPLRVDSLLAGPHQVFLDLDKCRRTYHMIHVRKNGLDSVTVRLEPKKAGEPDRPALGNTQAGETRLRAETDDSIPDKEIQIPLEKQPRPVTMPSPDVPGHFKGKMFVQMLVNTDGHVMRAEIVKSSGNPTLDSAVVGAARQWLFTPAIALDGKTVRVWVKQAIQFKGD